MRREARLAYEDAKKVAEIGLVVTHPIRLGLALNYSIFLYEVLANPEEARNGCEQKDCDTAGHKQSRYDEIANEMKSTLVKVGRKKDFVEKDFGEKTSPSSFSAC